MVKLLKCAGMQALRCLWTDARIQMTRNGCTVSLASVLHTLCFPGVWSVLRGRALLFCIIRVPTSSDYFVLIQPGRRVVHVQGSPTFSTDGRILLTRVLTLYASHYGPRIIETILSRIDLTNPYYTSETAWLPTTPLGRQDGSDYLFVLIQLVFSYR